MQPEISAIIIHFDRVDYTANVVRQLLDMRSPAVHEVIVVDNVSEQPLSADVVQGAMVLRITSQRGYGYACNRGAEAATGNMYFILNNDVEFQENPLPALLRELSEHPKVGAVGPVLRFPDGRLQPSYSDFPAFFSELRERKRQRIVHNGGGSALRNSAFSSDSSRSVDWITGACMLLPRTAWEAVRGFDEAYYFYFEDVDLCTRLRKVGFDVRFQAEVSVIHIGGGSDPLSNPRIVLSYRQEQLRYYARYNSALSFYLLKRFLRWKFTRLQREGRISKELKGQVMETIRTFSRSDERKRIQAAQQVTA